MSRLLCALLLLSCLPGCDREPEVIEDIRRWNKGLEPEDRERKYCKMMASPFTFFRGTAHLYWDALGQDERLELFGGRPKQRI